ncbi:ABC transporter G member 53 [Turnera subulata]|uniref:ABC transporter G member 53 n=1 Tax=Turnera subulata TaxID=218843 RepID=A0A9Q0FNC3_9ROSI|nr:ABC transporter G member 53 [Turnera subulata]
MESGDLYGAGSSLRRGNSLTWRNDGSEIFSTSFGHEQNDEEALIWAALEKQPTYDRVRKGVLTTSIGGATEIDVLNLGFQERRNLVERLVNVAEEDNEKFLLKLKKRFDRMTLLLGPPSCGKTTLLLALAGKLDRSLKIQFSGRVTYNGHDMNEFVPQRTAAYISQHDLHIGEMTVRETLAFSARCQGVGTRYELVAELSRREKAANIKPDPDIDIFMKVFIEEIMELVELNPLRQTIVGLPGLTGLSTEQRKRLTIAVELVANPSIIFMDEPTSGLDARAAAIVMRTVRNTVDTGRTVVCTIHQPSIDIFEAFDELLLLKLGGEEIYVGPLGRRSCHLIKYFEGIRGVRKIEDGYNPATWMLEVTTTAQEMSLGVDFAEIYKSSELYRRNKQLIKELSTPAPGSKDLHFVTQYSQSSLTQCLACLWKQHWSHWRNPPYTGVKFLMTTIVGILLGTMYWDLGSKLTKVQDLFNAMGSMYASVVFLGVQNAASALPVVDVERTVFYRERAAGMYSALPYALAQVIIELPYIFLQAAVYGIIVYAMIGFEWSVTKFFWFLYFMYFSFLYYTYYGMMTMAMSPNLHVALIFSTAFYAIWNLFSGFLIPHSRMPIWWQWYYWISPIAWSLNGLITSQFGDIKASLENGESVDQFLRSYFEFKHEFLWVVAAVVLGFAVLFAFVFAISIKLFNFQKR